MKKLLVLLLFYHGLISTLVYGQVAEAHSDGSQKAASESTQGKTAQLDWHAELKRLQDELARKPNSAFLHSQAATAYNALDDLPGFNREIHLAMRFDKRRAIYYYMAYAVYKQRRLKGLQIEALDQALQIDSDNPFGHYERAAMFEDESKWTDALAEYQVTQKLLDRVEPNPDSRSYSKWTYFDRRGDPYDMTIERAHIGEDLARVRAKLSAGKTAP